MFSIGKIDKGKKKTTETMFNSLLNFVSRIKGARVRAIDDKDLSDEDNIIALMGLTGTGKSSFIERVTGKSGLAGHSLESFTKEIAIFRFTFPEIVDSDICFVDTPGFDDTHGSDEKTLKGISNFIVDAQRKQLKLTGLLYFHRISDNRMTGSQRRNQRYFEELCDNEFEKIALVTTMWDQTDQATGETRERELKSDYWKIMLERGSSVRRFLHERSSAFDVLAPYFDEINRKSFRLLQEDVLDITSKLRHLKDGQRLSVELQRSIFLRQEMLQKIRAELRRPSLEETEIQRLMVSYEEEFKKLSHVATELETLSIQTGKYFKRVVWRMNWNGVISVYSPSGTTAPQIPLVSQRRVVSLELGEEATEEVHGTMDISGGMRGNTTPDKVQMTTNQLTRDEHMHSSRSPEEGLDVGYGQRQETTNIMADELMDGEATDDMLSELEIREYPLTGSHFSSEVDAEDHPQSISDKSAISPWTFNGDMVEARTPELWKNDDQLSDEDQEEAIDPKEDEPMQEQERRNFVCNSIYTRTSAGDWGRPYGFGSESETWDEFEEWKAEEERREYEIWCEESKTYEEFEMWTTHGHWGEWDGREGGAEDDENDYDDWSLFEQWQENEQWRKFNCLIEQEKHWSIIFKNETDWEGVRYF